VKLGYILILGAGVLFAGMCVLLAAPEQKWRWIAGMLVFLEALVISHAFSTRSKNGTASYTAKIVAAVVIGVAIAMTLWNHL
jgi:hypothetical protein